MPTQQPKKNSSLGSLLLVLLLLILGVGGYYAYTMYFPSSEVAPVVESVGYGDKDWNKELFQREDFTSLKSPIDLPFEPGNSGNTNPFIGIK